MAEFKDVGLMLSGDAYLAPIEGGKVGNLIGPINMPSVEVTPPTVNTVTRPSFKRASYGQSLSAVNTPGDPASLKIDFDSLPAVLLADALGGRLTERKVSAAVVRDTTEPEEITISLVKDEWVETGFLFLTSVVIDGATEDVDYSVDYEGGRIISRDDALSGSETIEIESEGLKVDLKEGSWTRLPFSNFENFSIAGLEEGVDYEVNATAGLVRAIKASAAGTGKIATFDVPEITEQVVEGATEIQKSRYFLLDGKNLDTGEDVTLEVWNVSFSASQATELMAQEFVTGQLTGSMVTPDDKSSPFELRVKTK